MKKDTHLGVLFIFTNVLKSLHIASGNKAKT